MKNELGIDKKSFDGNVCFNDDVHKYWVKGTDQFCISVTTIIHKFTQDFDAEF